MRPIALSLLLALTACSRGNDHGVGGLQAAIAVVPPSIHCLRIDAGSVSADFQVTPGQSAMVTLPELPAGSLALRARAYAASCGGQATWASSEVTATIQAGTVTPV